MLLEPAPFEVLYIAQKDYNNPTEIIAIIINADASFDEFYNNLSVVDKLNINVLNHCCPKKIYKSQGNSNCS
ncbi:MAG TPA: hypothetical protein PLQ81_07385, partial [bacterium]|nr:hypothetical protein [bacterium]